MGCTESKISVETPLKLSHDFVITGNIKKDFEMFSNGMKQTTPFSFVTTQCGYPLEKHVYYTEDGYINSIFRVPGRQGTKITKRGELTNKPVVLYQHGFFGVLVRDCR